MQHDLVADKGRNDALFNAFVNLVPAREVERRVDAYLRNLLESELVASLGHPDQILEVAVEDAGVDSEIHARLRSELKAVLAQAASKEAGVDAATVKAEAQHAREEVCRLWLDLLLLAVHALDVRELALTPSLKPQAPPEEWDTWLDESRDGMDANVALGRDDVAEVSSLYAKAVFTGAALKPIPIPGNFEFVRQNSKFIIRQTN